MPNTSYNPIRSVGGVALPCPSKYAWKLSDVSAQDAGRTEDALMHKMMIAQKVHLELEWQNISSAQAETILTAFNASEYLSVEYFDYKANGFLTKTFYVGDRTVESYSRVLDIATITFNIIER